MYRTQESRARSLAGGRNTAAGVAWVQRAVTIQQAAWTAAFLRPRQALSRDHASRRPAATDAGRTVLRAWRVPYRPGAAGGARADYPRPFRPCPARSWRGAGDAGNARPDAAALRRRISPAPRRRSATARASRSAACAATFHPAGHVLGSAQIAVEADGLPHRRLRRLQGRRATRPARRSNACRATCSSPRRPSACRCSAIGDPAGEIAKLLHSVALFPERAHLVGAYSLGKAQRVIALMRQAGYDAPIYLHGAMEKHHPLLPEPRHRAGRAPAGPRRRQEGSRRRHHAVPAIVDQRPVGAAVSRSGRPPSPRAGCGCGRAPGSAASNCRW